jgi:hypothetical protein
MPAHKLTLAEVEAAKPRATRYSLGDGSGLELVVHPSGGKNLLLRFMLAGERREMGLGRFVLKVRSTPGVAAHALDFQTSLWEFLHPQVWRPLCRVFALAGDIWPERVIAADLLDEELGAGGGHLVAEASDPIRMHRARSAA